MTIQKTSGAVQVRIRPPDGHEISRLLPDASLIEHSGPPLSGTPVFYANQNDLGVMSFRVPNPSGTADRFFHVTAPSEEIENLEIADIPVPADAQVGQIQAEFVGAHASIMGPKDAHKDWESHRGSAYRPLDGALTAATKLGICTTLGVGEAILAAQVVGRGPIVTAAILIAGLVGGLGCGALYLPLRLWHGRGADLYWCVPLQESKYAHGRRSTKLHPRF